MEAQISAADYDHMIQYASHPTETDEAVAGLVALVERGSRVLEPGLGKGRLAIPLGAENFEAPTTADRLPSPPDNANVISVRGSWDVQFHPAFATWADALEQQDAEALLAALRVLRDEGPTLGRPLVDPVVGSRHSNMKELRPGSTGRTEIRALFAFDKKRQAILLVGGDKSVDWRGWYDHSMPLADDRFDDHQAKLAKQVKPANKQKIQKKGRQKR